MKNLISKAEKDSIDLICKKNNIKNYSINPDGSIDTNGHVDFYDVGITAIPLRFNKIGGDFSCSSNNVTTLVGCPHTIPEDFACSYNRLTTLLGGPSRVGGDYSVEYNDLTSLVGGPAYIGGDFWINGNHLTTTYAGDTDIEVSGKVEIYVDGLPQLFQDNMQHIKLILKYQRHFFIWNDDLSLNIDNFTDLIEEIKDGLE